MKTVRKFFGVVFETALLFSVFTFTLFFVAPALFVLWALNWREEPEGYDDRLF